ncbi:unspecific monooxygenase [Amycolatopsis bartoniae]|uniref:Cytochrome P450 n=1 Tax=Amycolatopsis bartoniae TaxID=941986 RepID=A0A8H9J3K1_9PSEU|nr:cytochrome P450 [Amycolatopsis bartoniae]MBB2938628.1 unspecific monooxygenase [Amycolatopsis bartoniae]TVT08876.1 cytochrome P450 [Amycolatopsis bartoniae]GHF69638.1 cytochrome P450 [Amycolatopsis bartoniae]
MTVAPDAGRSLGTNLTSTFIQDSTRMAAEHGPVFRRSLHHLEFTFVTDPELVAELSDEQRFTKNVLPNLDALRPVLGDGLITAHTHEPNWRAAHELLMPAFSQAAMRRYHPVMLAVTGELVAAWDRAAGGAPVDVAADMTKMTLEVIGRAGFGYSFGSFETGRTHPFVTALKECMVHGQRTVTRPPIVGGLLGRRADERNAENIAYLNAVVDEVIDARGREGGDDLLTLMLAAGTLDRVNIRYQVLTFLAAGYETTATAAAFALYYLANNPDVLAAARAEADAVLGGEVPSFEQIGKLRYLRRVVDEALRLWPPAPGYARHALADTVLGGRYPMRAGESMFVLLPALHRHPVWGEDPEAFDPDRFLPERIRRRPAHAFKPFGTGQRACIGRQFAVHETLVVVSTLLHRYELVPDPDYRLRVQELIAFRPAGFTLGLRRR